MSRVTLKGNNCHTNGVLPTVGAKAPAFELVGADLGPVKLADFAGNNLVLNIFPSVDTPTCALSVRTFNQKAASLEGTKVLNVSRDLPFAQKRFCAAEGIEGVTNGSAFRSSFLKDYGVELVDGPLQGLAARAVVVLDGEGTVKHAQLVGEIADEPDYDAALASIS
ncbi:MAG TPA: thiol peroxidase [Planctomycetes bacterium]|nr:thiol peroxidase [Planctomycetota bacterium]